MAWRSLKILVVVSASSLVRSMPGGLDYGQNGHRTSYAGNSAQGISNENTAETDYASHSRQPGAAITLPLMQASQAAQLGIQGPDDTSPFAGQVKTISSPQQSGHWDGSSYRQTSGFSIYMNSSYSMPTTASYGAQDSYGSISPVFQSSSAILENGCSPYSTVTVETTTSAPPITITVTSSVSERFVSTVTVTTTVYSGSSQNGDTGQEGGSETGSYIGGGFGTGTSIGGEYPTGTGAGNGYGGSIGTGEGYATGTNQGTAYETGTGIGGGFPTGTDISGGDETGELQTGTPAMSAPVTSSIPVSYGGGGAGTELGGGYDTGIESRYTTAALVMSLSFADSSPTTYEDDTAGHGSLMYSPTGTGESLGSIFSTSLSSTGSFPAMTQPLGSEYGLGSASAPVMGSQGYPQTSAEGVYNTGDYAQPSETAAGSLYQIYGSNGGVESGSSATKNIGQASVASGISQVTDFPFPTTGSGNGGASGYPAQSYSAEGGFSYGSPPSDNGGYEAQSTLHQGSGTKQSQPWDTSVPYQAPTTTPCANSSTSHGVSWYSALSNESASLDQPFTDENPYHAGATSASYLSDSGDTMFSNSISGYGAPYPTSMPQSPTTTPCPSGMKDNSSYPSGNRQPVETDIAFPSQEPAYPMPSESQKTIYSIISSTSPQPSSASDPNSNFSVPCNDTDLSLTSVTQDFRSLAASGQTLPTPFQALQYDTFSLSNNTNTSTPYIYSPATSSSKAGIQLAQDGHFLNFSLRSISMACDPGPCQVTLFGAPQLSLANVDAAINNVAMQNVEVGGSLGGSDEWMNITMDAWKWTGLRSVTLSATQGGKTVGVGIQELRYDVVSKGCWRKGIEW